MDISQELIDFIEKDVESSRKASTLVDKLENMVIVAKFIKDQLSDSEDTLKKKASVGLTNLSYSLNEISEIVDSLRITKKSSRTLVGQFDVCPHLAPALHYSDFEMEHMDISDESKLAVRKFEHQLRQEHGAVDFDVEDDSHFGKCHLTGDPGMVVTVNAYADK